MIEGNTATRLAKYTRCYFRFSNWSRYSEGRNARQSCWNWLSESLTYFLVLFRAGSTLNQYTYETKKNCVVFRSSVKLLKTSDTSRLRTVRIVILSSNDIVHATQGEWLKNFGFKKVGNQLSSFWVNPLQTYTQKYKNVIQIFPLYNRIVV